jgi:hypothetical protein
MVKPDGTHREQSAGAVQRNEETSGTESLMEQVVAGENMLAALRRIERNGGAPGSDGMAVDELRGHLKAALLADTYKPQAVRRVEIPKPDGGVRLLGIPSVTDRLIQQAKYSRRSSTRRSAASALGSDLGEALTTRSNSRGRLWKQWKRPRTRLRELRALSLPEWVCLEFAYSRKGLLAHFGRAPEQGDAPPVLGRTRLRWAD